MCSYYISHDAFGIHEAIEGCDLMSQRQLMNIPTTINSCFSCSRYSKQLKREETLLYIVIL